LEVKYCGYLLFGGVALLHKRSRESAVDQHGAHLREYINDGYDPELLRTQEPSQRDGYAELKAHTKDSFDGGPKHTMYCAPLERVG
jgi:hypothetical protein